MFLKQIFAGEAMLRGQIKLFRERLSYKRGKAYATMSKVVMGNGGFTVT